MVGPTTYFQADGATDLPEGTRELLARRDAVLGAPYRLFYRRPLTLVKGLAAVVTDDEGREYLDCYNNVPVVGHAHPLVAEAVWKQMGIINTHTRYLHPDVIDYAEKLVASMPHGPDRVVFTCTGSEANDLALRVARSVTGNEGVIVTEYSYHGITEATAEISPSLVGEENVGDRVVFVSSPAKSGDWATEIHTAIDTLNARGKGVAAIVLDTIFASDGLWPKGESEILDRGITAATDAVRKAGGLVIADEVQGGFGRVGSGLWGHVGRFVPDMVSLGKPMGNGYPVAGLVAKKHLFDEFSAKTRYFNTFGGSPVAIAAASATWEILHEEGLPDHAQAMEHHLHSLLEPLASHPRVAAIRGVGLYASIDLQRRDGTPDEPATIELVNALREDGVLIAASGPTNSSLKIRPPLAITTSQVETLAEVLTRHIQALEA